mmetsp:Transcript_7441/g.12127  ORF Transcript_7441/g.12127 Transcript_7441/m.12127 type:complete len:322 (-) Transcript_7441:864-1829(-)
MASSTWLTVATPSFTKWRDSRHKASKRRSETKPGTSFPNINGCIPTDLNNAAAFIFAFSNVFSPPKTSTSGNKYTGLKGCATTKRSGWVILDCNKVGKRPDVEELITTSGGRCFSINAYAAIFTSRFSGKLSTTCSACFRASAASASPQPQHLTIKFPCLVVDSLERPGMSFSMATTALLTTCFTTSSAFLDGSITVTSMPFKTNRAAHPLPMTPPPMHTTRLISFLATCVSKGTVSAALATSPNFCIIIGSGNGVCLTNFNFLRTSSGPNTLHPIDSKIVFAFATSCSFVAKTPRERYKLSSKPTLTLPPSSGIAATQGI